LKYIFYIEYIFAALTKTVEQMPRMLIDLTEKEAQELKELATLHGHKVKPFVEYIVRMQIGTLPAPTVAPLALSPAQDTEQETHEEEPQQEQREEPRAGRAPRMIKPWIPNKNLAAYTEETEPGSGIFTDGKSFAVQVGPVGRQSAHFFQFIHEAEEFKGNEAS
jgi:hypothetical protein